MSQPLPSRQRKAWLPPSFSAVRYPAIPRPTRARTTTIQSGCPGAAATGSAAARFTFAMGLLSARGRAFCARIIAQSRAEPGEARLAYEREAGARQGGADDPELTRGRTGPTEYHRLVQSILNGTWKIPNVVKAP